MIEHMPQAALPEVSQSLREFGDYYREQATFLPPLPESTRSAVICGRSVRPDFHFEE
jgi:hypothetical protein